MSQVFDLLVSMLKNFLFEVPSLRRAQFLEDARESNRT
jgi:hypothetical protein